MADQYQFSPVLRNLVTDMLRMLITFEMELTAYNIVPNRAQDKIIQAGIP
jgi:hypothetical protein